MPRWWWPKVVGLGIFGGKVHGGNITYESLEMMWAPGCLGYIGDYTIPSYVGIIMNHYKNPYETTSIMESKRFLYSCRGSSCFFCRRDPIGRHAFVCICLL